MTNSPLFQLANLKLSYGAIEALKGIDFSLQSGELLALIGANGAGKTSTLKAIMGLLPCSADLMQMAGRSLIADTTERRVRRGLVLVPEGRGIFTRLTVMENLKLGAFLQKNLKENQALLAQILEEFPILKNRAGQLAGFLSGGEQQLLALARARLARPKLLLLDEPTMGLAPLMVEQVLAQILAFRAQGTAIIWVEQNTHLALKHADHACVLASGKVVLSGVASELAQDLKVRQAYLGEVVAS